ncbi:hypothetical protein [Niveibacterium terrae]|uniref:hypothetical protein n=1 Tax=Niveibacterium terrae TaxID=3373598 RepID=UPI003A8EE6F8
MSIETYILGLLVCVLTAQDLTQKARSALCLMCFAAMLIFAAVDIAKGVKL